MNISLIYFNFPFWRAEVSRISLFLNNIEFEDKRITSEEFQRVKKDGVLDDGTIIPFHQLPCLKINGYTIAQTGAISRFCGKLSNLYPKNDDFLAAQIDQFIDLLTDITTLITSTQVENRDTDFLISINRKLYILNKSIDQKNDYIVKGYFSIADIATWSFMCWLTGGNIASVPKDIAKKYTNIISLCRKIDKKDIIQKWINKTFPKKYPRNFY
tara:strand:+ start:435 stop:1076 length:642 start_codon:yes stop_codon:yes gene_type:complete